MKESRTVRGIVIGIAVVVIVLIIFKAGVYVGYRKAAFTSGLGDTYFRTLVGRPGQEHGMTQGFFRDDIPGGHGVSGKVIKVNPSSIVVEGTDNIENIITLNDETLVRRFRDTASTTALEVNDNVIVIGSPGQNGEIVAKLIRIIPEMPQ